ncbi:MAG TPA: hypothetical protein PKV72_05795, partial [Candidatus Peribacteria bacterium]|nr:hypothetical protein [Candidatus Peribacteria bacterium]
LGDARYVKKQGDTMTGALTINLTSGSLGLKIIQTASGNIIHAEKTLTSSGTIVAVGSITTRNTLSGKTLVVSGNASVTGSLVVNRSISGATLEILGTASGANLYATRSITGTNIYAATTFGGAGLASCSTALTSKLLYNSATKQFSCGTDNTGGSAGTASFSGSVLLLGDARYVKKQGDTMTGALTISLTSGTVGLRVLGAMSGNTLTVSKGIHAAGSGVVITSSGQTVFNALSRNVDFTIRGVSSSLFVADASADRIGIGTAAPKATLDIVGTLSGRNLVISNHAAFSGAVLIGNNSTDVVTFKSVISGSLIPAVTNTYSLGSDTLRWKNFFLSGAIALGVSGDNATIQYDTVGDRIKFDADADGNIDFRMADIGSFDILESSSNAPTASNYARLFARPSTSGGNDSDTTYLVEAEDSSGIATNTAQGKTNTNSHGGSCIYNSATQAKFGSNSISLNCSGYQYYRFSSTNDDYFVTGDFTVDAWVYEDANTSVNRVLIAQTAVNDHQWALMLTSGNKLQGQFKTSTGMTVSITDTVNFPTAQWVHVAFERSGNTFRVYKNGTAVGTNISSSASLKTLSSRYLMLGNRYPYNFAGDQNFTGYMDEIRISKVARYSGNFTPPVTAYAGDTGGLFVRLSNGRLINLTGSGSSSGGGGGDSVWTVNSDNSIYYNIGQVGVGTTAPVGQMEVQQDDYFGSGALVIDQNVTTGTGIFVGSEATGAPGIAITMPGNATSNNPHLLFGYSDIFDTNLYRPLVNTLRTDGSFQVGGALTVTGTTTLNGNTVIGSDSSDTVTFNALVNSNITPSVTNTYDLGTDALRWRDLYLSGGTIDMGQSGNNGKIRYNTTTSAFNLDAGANNVSELSVLASGRVGVGTTAPKATLDVLGTSSGTDLYAARSISGAYLYAASTFGGAGLASCSNATASKLLYNSATKQFSCGTDQGAWSNTGSLRTYFDTRYVKKQGDTMTGALTINLTSGSLGLKIIQTASGNII